MKHVTRFQRQLNSMLVDFLAVIGLSKGLDLKRSGNDPKPDGCWDNIVDKMLRNFAGFGHPVFRGTSVLERRELTSKVGGKTSIHFNGSTENIELLLQMVISVNQVSLYGAVADMIEELSVGRRALGKLVASGQLDKQEILAEPAETQANEERQGDLLQEYEERFEKLTEDRRLSKLCSEAGLRLVEIGQFFYALPSQRGEEHQSLCREYTLLRDQKETKIKGWIQSNVRFRPVTDIKVCNNQGRYSLEVQVQSLFKDRTESWIRIVNGVDKFVRKAMPIQEEEKTSGKPAAKARPIFKSSATSDVTFIPIGRRKWIDNCNTRIK